MFQLQRRPDYKHFSILELSPQARTLRQCFMRVAVSSPVDHHDAMQQPEAGAMQQPEAAMLLQYTCILHCNSRSSISVFLHCNSRSSISVFPAMYIFHCNSCSSISVFPARIA